MKLNDVTVNQILIRPGMKEPEVKALVTLDFRGINQPQTTWIDLKSSETAAILETVHAIEQRVLDQDADQEENTQASSVDVNDIRAIRELGTG